ncbi:MAG: hypothetical protein PF961_02395 [Planctomycetota bacterium]|jgi:hypothetical protein|nr:hypothetical protein [Planctomycetota bacterium]
MRMLFIALAMGLLAAPLSAAVVDDCDDSSRFFLYPGEKNVAAMSVVEGTVVMAKTPPGDAFTRWSSAPMARIPINAEHNKLAIHFGPFTGKTSAHVTLDLYRGKKRVGSKNLPKVTVGDQIVEQDLEAIAAEIEGGADGFALFIRHGGDASGTVVFDRIAVTAK